LTHAAHANVGEAATGQATPAGPWPGEDPAAGGFDDGADAGAPAAGVRAGAAPSGARATGAAGVGGARTRRAWPLVVALCAAVALVAAGGAWLAFRVLRRPSVTDVPVQPAAPPVADAARQEFERRLADAEAALAAGDMDGALARLREANALDPANTRAHRRLAELLLSTGARREAIEELRAVARNAPEDFTAWRQLAAAQFAEGLHRDAAESYRRLVALIGEPSVEPADLLAYADALRLSGGTEEARTLYGRLLFHPTPEIASAAREHLAELGRAQATPTPAQAAGAQPSPTPGETASVAQPAAPPAAAQPQPTPTPPPPAPAPPAAPSPAERYGRGVQLWSSNRGAALEEFRAAAAGGNLDAHYFLGLDYVEGRRASSLNRAALVAALQHFQLAQRGGQHASRARGYAQQLEKEFDRLRRQ
jgi:tetratricopeptide (TPR) repeat protein